MMDKSAIQQIQESANIPALIESVGGAHIPTVVIPCSFSIESLEDKMEFASRYRLKFKTSSISDYTSYVSDFDSEGAACFVSADDMAARTVFDLGSTEAPGHKAHSATLTLRKTAAFSALLASCGSQKTQKSAAEFIEDWADNFVIYTSQGDALSPVQAVKALLDLTIESARSINTVVGDFNEGMSAMEKIEAKNKDKLPSEMQFTCNPYLGLGSRTFRVRVSMITSSDKPVLVFRVLKLEQHEEEMAEEFQEILGDGFAELSLKVFIGSI